MTRPHFCRSRRGLALALVTVHATLILSAWAIANRHTVDLVQLEQYMSHRDRSQGYQRAAARRLALAYGLALLETGVPPADPVPYACAVDVDPNPSSTEDAPLTFSLTFFQLPVQAPVRRWQVAVQFHEPPAPGQVAVPELPRPWRFPAPPANAEPDSESSSPPVGP